MRQLNFVVGLLIFKIYDEVHQSLMTHQQYHCFIYYLRLFLVLCFLYIYFRWRPLPPPFSLAHYYEHIMNICFSSTFALRSPSVLSSFLHAIWSALSSLLPRHFLLLFQNENLFRSKWLTLSFGQVSKTCRRMH